MSLFSFFMGMGRVLSAGAAVVIGLLFGAVLGLLTGQDPVETSGVLEEADLSDEAPPTDSDDSESEESEESAATTTPAPVEATADTEPIELDTGLLNASLSKVVLIEALGCGGASWFTAFNDASAGIYPESLATHSWLVTQISPTDGREVLTQRNFVAVGTGAAASRLIQADLIQREQFLKGSFALEPGLEVAVLGVEPNRGADFVLGTLSDVSSDTLRVDFSRQVPASYEGAPVVAGSAELIGVYTSGGVIGVDALRDGSPPPSSDCRTATHSVTAVNSAAAIAPQTQEVLVAQNWVNQTANGEYALADQIDIGRTTAVDWPREYGPLVRGWLVPIRNNGGGSWRFGYHTFEARDSRDLSLATQFNDVNRLFCVTWVVDRLGQTVNQQTARSTHRPNSTDRDGSGYYSSWNRVDASRSDGLVDANELVGFLQSVC